MSAALMPQKYSIKFTNDETGEAISVDGELSDIEVKILEAFAREPDAVWKTDFIQIGEKGRLNVEWNEKIGLKVTTVLLNWDQVIVFLHKFRPVLLQDEKTNFYKVHSLLGRNLNHYYLRDWLKLQKDFYSGRKSQSEFQLELDGVVINSEKILLDWLNSHDFHREESKQELIESLHQMIPLYASKVIFLGLLIDKAIASVNVANMALVVLGKLQGMKINTKRQDSNVI